MVIGTLMPEREREREAGEREQVEKKRGSGGKEEKEEDLPFFLFENFYPCISNLVKNSVNVPSL
jgi:hypothetical protein